MKAIETAVDIFSKNSHGNVCWEVLDKAVAWQLGICYLFRTKIFSRCSEHTEAGTVNRCSVKKKCS